MQFIDSDSGWLRPWWEAKAVADAAHGVDEGRFGGGVLCGEKDDGDLCAGPFVLAESTGNFEAVQVGEHHVKKDQIGTSLVDCGQCLAAGRGAFDIEAVETECHRHEFGDVFLVVNGEHKRLCSTGIGHDCRFLSASQAHNDDHDTPSARPEPAETAALRELPGFTEMWLRLFFDNGLIPTDRANYRL